MGKLVTTTELVEVLGVSRTTLAKEVESGRLTVKTRDGRGRPQFDLEQAVREWGERRSAGRNANRAKGGNRGGRPPRSEDGNSSLPAAWAGLTPAQQLVRAEVVKKTLDSKRVALQVKREEGRLVDVEKVQADGAELATILLGALSALPARLYQQLAVMTDPREIHDLLTDEANQMMEAVRERCGLATGNDDAAEKKMPE